MAPGNIKNFELKVGKAGLIIIVAGMAALLCTAFLFGVDVGKNVDTYPEKIAAIPQRILAIVWRPAKIGTFPNAPDDKNEQNQSSNKEDIDLTFYNTLTSKKGVSQDQPVTDKQSVQIVPPKNEGGNVTGNINIDTTRQSAEPVIETIIEKSESKGKGIAPSLDSGKQKFTIQAASLKDKSKANKMNKKIASLGFVSQVIKVDVKGKGALFRVVVSGFEDKVKADEAAQKISRKTGTNCIVKSVDGEAKKN
ncbi:MAG: SPOR domain-containing protein [Deltaproteobacteria bacterium]|nr:SPOR domain-containing protein [Deltaproteobacteria bacterium]